MIHEQFKQESKENGADRMVYSRKSGGWEYTNHISGEALWASLA